MHAGGVEHVHGLQPREHKRQHVEERCSGAVLLCYDVLWSTCQAVHCTMQSAVTRHALATKFRPCFIVQYFHLRIQHHV